MIELCEVCLTLVALDEASDDNPKIEWNDEKSLSKSHVCCGIWGTSAREVMWSENSDPPQAAIQPVLVPTSGPGWRELPCYWTSHPSFYLLAVAAATRTRQNLDKVWSEISFCFLHKIRDTRLLRTLEISRGLRSPLLHCFKETLKCPNRSGASPWRTESWPDWGTLMVMARGVRAAECRLPISSPVRRSNGMRTVTRGVTGMQRRSSWSGGYSGRLCASVHDARH